MFTCLLSKTARSPISGSMGWPEFERHALSPDRRFECHGQELGLWSAYQQVIDQSRFSMRASAGRAAPSFELLDRGVHRVEAVGVELERADRFDAGNEEDEAARQVALPVLVLAAELRLAQACVFLAERRLAPAEDADRPLARGVHRHRRIALAVAHLAVGRVLAPELLF